MTGRVHIGGDAIDVTETPVDVVGWTGETTYPTGEEREGATMDAIRTKMAT